MAEHAMRRRDKRKQEKPIVGSINRIEKQLSIALQNEQGGTTEFSQGFQHGLKSALRLIDIEQGKDMRP